MASRRRGLPTASVNQSGGGGTFNHAITSATRSRRNFWNRTHQKTFQSTAWRKWRSAGHRFPTRSTSVLGTRGGPGGSAPLPGPPLPRKGSPAGAGLRTSVPSQAPEEEMSGVRHNVSTLHDSPRAAIRPTFRWAKAPAGGSRPGRAVQDRACRIGSDAARLGRLVLTKSQRRTREDPDDRGGYQGLYSPDGVSVGGMGGGTPIQPAVITRARKGVPSSVTLHEQLEHQCPSGGASFCTPALWAPRPATFAT
jgi:hypothetical protein